MEMLKAAFTLHFDDRTKPSFAVSEARVLNHYDAPSVDKMLTVALTRENRSRRDYEVTSVRYFDNDFNAWVNVSLTDHHVHLREYEVHLEKIEKVAYTLIVFAIGVVFFFGHAPMTSVILIIVAVFYLWQNSRDRSKE
ncbi:hypothetical protein AAVH_15308 [Aphelenchoides avenae]|nr:hypothetical protein AAVH_15308 [Aphelenchus avenae]